MPIPISGFMPLPLAMMIPFMGAQSAVMAKQFGENFQYGKRRISAMTNEEFNKLTPAKLAERTAQELKAMIPSMESSITDMRLFQSFLVREFIATVKQLPSDIGGAIFGNDDTTGIPEWLRAEGRMGPGISQSAITAMNPSKINPTFSGGSSEFVDAPDSFLKKLRTVTIRGRQYWEQLDGFWREHGSPGKYYYSSGTNTMITDTQYYKLIGTAQSESDAALAKWKLENPGRTSFAAPPKSPPKVLPSQSSGGRGGGERVQVKGYTPEQERIFGIYHALTGLIAKDKKFYGPAAKYPPSSRTMKQWKLSRAGITQNRLFNYTKYQKWLKLTK